MIRRYSVAITFQKTSRPAFTAFTSSPIAGAMTPFSADCVIAPQSKLVERAEARDLDLPGAPPEEL